MKIVDVVCTPYSVPLKGDIKMVGAVITKLHHVLVEVRTDEGIVGVGEALARPHVYGESQRGIVAAIEEWFAPALIGRDPLARDQIWKGFGVSKNNHSAKAALDIALFDIIGKVAGLSCRRLLGGFTDTLSVSYLCGIARPEEVAASAVSAFQSHGIAAFKLKAGLNPDGDITMMRAVREALPEAILYIDGNEGYNGPEAVRVLSAGRDLGVAWAEEPVSMDDRAGRRMLAGSGVMAVLGDDSCRTLAEVTRELSEGLVQIVSIKVARTGFTLSEQIHGLCAGHGARMLIGSQGDSGLGTAASWHFGAAHELTSRLPGELSFSLAMDGDIVEETPHISGGKLTYPERPGLGVTIDRRRLAQLVP